ncbi:hypothetical protein [Erwinia phage FBB1]|nr:hypothetical protein [Erwinia phage FBB1]
MVKTTFGKLKKGAEFKFQSNGIARTKTSFRWAKGHKFDCDVESNKSVYADESQIKPWWKLW